MTYEVLLNIDGHARPSSSGASFEIRNPLRRQVVGKCASATLDDVQAACDAAARTFDAWAATPLPQKRTILEKAAALIESDAFSKRMIDAMITESAMTPAMAAFNVKLAATYFRHAAGLGTQLHGLSFDSDVPGGEVIVKRKAAGVVFSGTPWNAPPTLAARALAVPLFCGNTHVIKASEFAPWSTYLTCEALWEAGLPKGVLNFVVFERKTAAELTEAAIAHPAVKRITFTGSWIVGSKIAQVAGKYLKKCIMELGGSNELVVLADANLEDAARAIVFGSLQHGGQICMGTERVIAHKDVAQRLNELLKIHVSRLRAGEGQPISSLFSDQAAKHALEHIEDAIKAGAKVEVGDRKRDGAVVQPHLLTNVKPGTESWHEETFGPIVAVTVAESDEDAIRLANDTEYSLTAALWTSDVHKAMKYGQQLRAGTVMVNGPTLHLEAYMGNAGLCGKSGYGRFNVDDFTDQRSIVFAAPRSDYPLTQPV